LSLFHISEKNGKYNSMFMESLFQRMDKCVKLKDKFKYVNNSQQEGVKINASD